MFNLLMLGNIEDWNVNVGVETTRKFPLSRFLEYTEPSIQERFTPVTDENLAFLQTIPAIFMSEVDVQPNGDRAVIRTGVILNTRLAGRELQYTFRFDRDLGETNVPDRKAFERAFSMGKFEFHRTHWAVKATNLVEALAAADLGVDATLPSLQSVSMDALPEPQAENPIVIDDLGAFMDEVLKMEQQPDEEIFYRGHSDKDFKLVPSLFRRNDSGGYRYRPKEEALVRELLATQASHFASDQYMLDRLVRMQHYGLPTRLLDVSSNPLVGLYFSCAESKKDKAGNEISGEVVVLKVKSSDIFFFDSDTVSCIANLCLMSDEEKNRMDTSSTQAVFNETDDCKKLLHFIRREKPYFEPRIVPEDLERIVVVKGRNTHERIISQSGAFLMFGKDSIFPETGRSGLSISRLVITNKEHILGQLGKLNIKASTVYPGLEKSAADVSRKYAEN